MLGKLDFRNLHLRNKDYQRNGFQILSEEITLNNTVNISKGIEIWNKQFMDINISTNILSCHSLIYTEATIRCCVQQLVKTCIFWWKARYVTNILFGVFIFKFEIN